MEDLRSVRRAEAPPTALLAIALAATLPFPVSALVYCYGPEDLRGPGLTGLVSWSAIVIAFIGGVRWGLETLEPRPRPLRLLFSALCAGAALVVLLWRGEAPDAWLLALFIAAFMAQWLFDHRVHDGPQRYPTLSTGLALAACLSLALALEQALNG